MMRQESRQQGMRTDMRDLQRDPQRNFPKDTSRSAVQPQRSSQPQQQRDPQQLNQRQGGQTGQGGMKQNSPGQGQKNLSFLKQHRTDPNKPENAADTAGSGHRDRNEDRRNPSQRDRQFARQNMKKEVETVEDIRKDIARLEKEIELDIREIASMRLGI